ncbi:hypothetical protein ACFWGP_05590 [Agromyces sp. NPDC127015]|uniref:hypothetical protein n=1 Tax=Agromyces sp. NPDC127015 TaxID=3347108 RepID=UPI003655A829
MNRRQKSLVYAVYWQSARVFKVGTATSMARVREHARRGARVMVLVRDRNLHDETRALNALKKEFRRAFPTWQHATAVLGDQGSGFTECFAVPMSRVPEATDLVLRALARG